MALLSPEHPAVLRGTEQESSVRRPRRLVLSAAALGLALAATGCTYFNPVQTHDFYQAGDGTNANIEQSGQLAAGIRNAIVVVAEDGSAAFSATAVNYTDQELTVELKGIGDDGSTVFSSQVTVPAQQTLELGPGEGQEPVEIGDLGAQPGSVIDLSITVGEQSTVITLPIISTELGHYGLESAPAEG
ncbi:hypothetical protein ACFQS2_14495 [Brachybacterium sp. GCM10030267]|uniref:hypothetical protein n=1 Tax=Brachybacterium sp. GCM10030267 TaxID=3273381 RepID=UPI003605D178